MAAPTVVSTYPADGDIGIPVGVTLKVYFDVGVDEKTIKDSIALFGNDNDYTSGPESATWVDQDTGDNPFFLSSPGFKGLIPFKLELAYYTLSTTTEVDPGVITSQADEVTANVGHVAKITVDPKYNPQLPANSELTLVIAGDPGSQDIGISARTTYDIVADVSNTGSGAMYIWGTWKDTGAANDTIHVKVTTAGNLSTAEYKWWYEAAGEGSATTGVLTSRRFRTLEDGLQIRFGGTNLVLDDEWTFNVTVIERMLTSTTVTFTTNDGSYTTAPASPSTPATSSPPSSVLPTLVDTFEVTDMSPANGSYNISVKNRKIVVTFSDDLDAATCTQTSVKLFKYPVSGDYDDTYSPIELQKTLEVSDNVLTIKF